jgi:hypothetical protein
MGKKYTTEERKVLCESWRQSGISKINFCKENEVSEYALRKWLKESDGSAKTGSTLPIKFLQVTQSAQTRNLVEAVLPNGIILKFDLCFGGALKELLQWK